MAGTKKQQTIHKLLLHGAINFVCLFVFCVLWLLVVFRCLFVFVFVYCEVALFVCCVYVVGIVVCWVCGICVACGVVLCWCVACHLSCVIVSCVGSFLFVCVELLFVFPVFLSWLFVFHVCAPMKQQLWSASNVHQAPSCMSIMQHMYVSIECWDHTLVYMVAQSVLYKSHSGSASLPAFISYIKWWRSRWHPSS